jgi:hypothetical protein
MIDKGNGFVQIQNSLLSFRRVHGIVDNQTVTAQSINGIVYFCKIASGKISQCEIPLFQIVPDAVCFRDIRVPGEKQTEDYQYQRGLNADVPEDYRFEGPLELLSH